jgi:hypothetical protein
MHATSRRFRRTNPRQRGAAAILAMMFLVIFSALAAAMAVVSEGNLIIADSNLRVSRSQAAAETGLQFVIYHLNESARKTTTDKGLITESLAETLWLSIREDMLTRLSNNDHNIEEPYVEAGVLHIGPIAVGPGAPQFKATIAPHPLADENYGSAYYQRPPYNDTKYFNPVISAANPLDSRWVRVRVEATDTSLAQPITRSVQMDFKIEKKIRFAILSKNRVMIGRNVMIEGPIGSRFMETHLKHGHPIQMESDFIGLDNDLDSQLTVFRNTLATNDQNHDNRLDLSSASETAGITNPHEYDLNGDGFIDDFDFFLAKFDSNGDKKVSLAELDAANHINRKQLLEMIDTFGDKDRDGYNDGVIDEKDRYSKIRGEVYITASMESWNSGAAKTGTQPGQYQDFFQGPLTPGYQQRPLTFGASDSAVGQFGPEDFDVSTLKAMAVNNLHDQAAAAIANAGNNPGPDAPSVTQQTTPEAVPFGAANPYDYYYRPVYENMTFTNVTIPKGTNALFKNCTFIGVTFVDTEPMNNDPNYNYNGMIDANGQLKHADKAVTVGNETIPGNDPNNSTKNKGNNLRFDNCTFEGAIVSNVPQSYTQVRNKLNFTGDTKFKDLTDPTQTPNLTQEQRELFRRSTIMAPHMSVEVGTFAGVSEATPKVHLSGVIVAGIIDLRGDIRIDGTLLTTFEPRSNEGPVIGETSPNFNTTLGYFAKTSGDMEANTLPNGLGKIQIRYDPTLPLPDGITAPVSLTPLRPSFFEGGK